MSTSNQSFIKTFARSRPRPASGSEILSDELGDLSTNDTEAARSNKEDGLKLDGSAIQTARVWLESQDQVLRFDTSRFR